MFKKFYPKEYVDSAYSIDFRLYYDKGYRSVILDVDNTLVEHGAPCNDKAREFFKNLKSIGFKTCIISNNSKERVEPFAQAVDSDFIFRAGKPKRAGYIEAMRLTGTNKYTALFVGDQLFTDIWGANRAGIHSILVKYIKKDYEIQIRLKRLGEAIVLKFYQRR